MREVLEAERLAQASIEAAKGRAAAAVAQAEEEARAIARRAEARLAAARRSVSARLARRQAEADARAKALAGARSPVEVDPGGLDAALDEVAALLTSGHAP